MSCRCASLPLIAFFRPQHLSAVSQRSHSPARHENPEIPVIQLDYQFFSRDGEPVDEENRTLSGWPVTVFSCGASDCHCPYLPASAGDSRPSWRPPRGLCAVWTFAGTGGGPGTGSSPHMQGSGGTGNNKHPGQLTRSGYDPRITTDARRGAKATGDLRRGSSAGCSSQERANTPRTSPQPTLQIGGLRTGRGRQVEPGGNLLHQAPGTT